MAKQVKKSKAEVATIDCNLITIQTATGEFGFDTANKVEVDPQIEEQEAVKLVIKGVLRAQKQKESTITGHELKVIDNVFNPELVLVLQGGKIIYAIENPEEIIGYEPPVVGSKEKGEIFTLNCYTAQYDGSGQIVKYEKMSYPNCTGVPVAFNSEDGAFRAPEYTINSAPKTGEAPYKLGYVYQLPTLVDEYVLSTLAVTSIAGMAIGKTKLTVAPTKDDPTNKYYYKTDATTITLPLYGAVVSGYTEWNGVEELAIATGTYVAIVETSSDGKALSGGVTQATAML